MPLIIQSEYLSIAGTALATPSYRGVDLSDLLRPADQRGSDRVIPHGTVIAKPRRTTASKRSLAATLVLASGSRTADVHVEALDIGDRDGPILFATLQLSIPAGLFV
ncbi:MAG: hypothetical protein LC798_19610 [Chloroflexi bacterium]|nr:hypothetical protein [Chloroflexota bacterium]